LRQAAPAIFAELRHESPDLGEREAGVPGQVEEEIR
jgi:hypothetical protein